MAKLTFSGRSTDGGHLLLKDESGQTYTLAIDARLRNALRGTPERNGQLEIQMESALRPRDIQARIRAGETPESVAQAAGTDVERIMVYAAPVLAERAHVAQRAQLSSVRRRSGEGGARTLGEAVAAHLRANGVDPSSVEWDAWRREDGRWTLTGSFSGPRSGTATYSYDQRGNFVTVEDDDGRWLVGDAPSTPAAAGSGSGSAPLGSSLPSDDLAAARQRRLSAVPADELPLGDDAIEMVAGGSSDTDSETTLELGLEQPMLEEPEPVLDEQPQAEPSAEEAKSEQAADPAAQEPAAKKPAKRRGRASVPSWDEIMFGGGKGD